MPEYATLLFEVKDHVAHLILNRPETEDVREAITAFATKRASQSKGRSMQQRATTGV